MLAEYATGYVTMEIHHRSSQCIKTDNLQSNLSLDMTTKPHCDDIEHISQENCV